MSNQQPYGGPPQYQPVYQRPPQQQFGWGPQQFGGPPPPKKKSKAWILIPLTAGLAGDHRPLGDRRGAQGQPVRQLRRPAAVVDLQPRAGVDRAHRTGADDHAGPAGRDVFRPPNLITMNGSVRSPCGGSAGRSFYCESNETIYIDSLDDVRQYAKNSQNYARTYLKVTMAQTMAHEYGHHVQHLTGILSAFNDLWYEAPNRTARLEVNRRMELQATCLGAMFQGANRNTIPVSGEYKRQWTWLTSHLGDEYDTERTHGSRLVHPYWMNRGFNSRNVALCNTFTATSDKVR